MRGTTSKKLVKLAAMIANPEVSTFTKVSRRKYLIDSKEYIAETNVVSWDLESKRRWYKKLKKIVKSLPSNERAKYISNLATPNTQPI